jgi:hypothetical protein
MYGMLWSEPEDLLHARSTRLEHCQLLFISKKEHASHKALVADKKWWNEIEE